jgi:BolA protein
MNRIEQITERLNKAFNPLDLGIQDDSAKHAGHAGAAAGGGHFNIIIVSEKFAGHAPVARHQMVYRALADMMPAEIHALGINALTPAEQKNQQ